MSSEFKLANGSLLLSTEAPGGIYNSDQLKKIASICEGDSAVVKATEDQRIALFVPAEKAAAIAEELQSIGLGIRNYQEGLHQPTTCMGEMCSQHLQDAMGAAMELTARLAPITLKSPLKIGINGCASCCVPTHTLDISLIGDVNGYRVSLGGKNSQIPEMASFVAEGVPTEKLLGMVENIIKIYAENCEEDESLQDVMERCGSACFIEALAPYSQDAAAADPLDFTSEVIEEAPEVESELDESLGGLDLNDLPHVDELESEEELEIEAASESLDELGEVDFEDNESRTPADTELEELPISEIESSTLEDEESIGFQDDLEKDEESNDRFDESEFQAEEVSAEDEEAFEEKINASIDDQENFGEAEDPNSPERLEAMSLIEGDIDEPIRLPISNSNNGKWGFSGIELTAAGQMVIQFDSGAAVTLEISVFEDGNAKTYNLGGQIVTIEPDSNGITVDVGGVSCYLPSTDLKVG